MYLPSFFSQETAKGPCGLPSQAATCYYQSNHQSR